MAGFGFELDPNDLPEDMPDVFKDAIRRSAARQQRSAMISDDLNNRTYGFFDELNDVQRSTLLLILSQCENPSLVHYFEGYLIAQLRASGVCIGCGEHHPLDGEHGVPGPTEDSALRVNYLKSDGTPATGSVTVSRLDDDPDSPVIPVDESEQDAVTEVEQTDAMFELFGVEESFDPPGVRCTGPCGGANFWSSLEDRMLGEPGIKGCGLCQNKEKWG